MDKRILIIDESESCIQKLTILFKEHTSFNVDVTSDYDEALKFFNENTYENIIIDHNCKVSNPFMGYILEKKPEQRVILLSDTLDCPIDCTNCLHTFHFVRLLKPINYKEVLKYINTEYIFECPNKFRFENVDNLEKLYGFINIENNFFYVRKEFLEEKIVVKAKSSSPMNFNELSKLQTFISKEYFKFEVEEDFSVVITMKDKD